MYDLTKMKTGLNVKCKDLAKELMKYPEAEIAICGDSWVYLHVEQDGSIINLDNEDLEGDCYVDQLPDGVFIGGNLPAFDHIEICEKCGSEMLVTEGLGLGIEKGAIPVIKSMCCSNPKCNFKKIEREDEGNV